MERRSSGGAHVVMAEFGTQRSTCHGESPPPRKRALYLSTKKSSRTSISSAATMHSTVSTETLRVPFST